MPDRSAQDYLCRRLTAATVAGFLALPGLALPAAHAAKSDWAAAEESRLRLLVGEASQDGTISGGIEIEIRPGWHTYWRNPGEVGLPPVFDFSRSQNVAAVEVGYPVPERYDDGASVSLIYRDEALFPFSVTPETRGEPVTLRLDARFGVCSTVCIPTAAEAALPLPPVVIPDPPIETRLKLAAARLPGPAEPGRFDIERVGVEGDDLVIDVRGPQSSYRDLFVEPPVGWFTGQPELILRNGALSRYRMSLEGRPQGATIGGQRFRFVAVAGNEAIEEIVTLP